MSTDVNVMIDIETLCNDSSGGVILEIGACIFNLSFDAPLRSIATHTYVGAEWGIFRQVIDLESSLGAGLKIEASTLRWWMADDARAEILRGLLKSDNNGYEETLVGFRSWLGNICNHEWHRLQVWSHGAGYDLVMLENHYKSALGQETPWEFRHQNDTRTLIRLYKDLFGVEVPKEENVHLHNSLADACYQARQMQHIVKKFKDLKFLAMRSTDYREFIHKEAF